MQAIEAINRALFLAFNATPETPHGLVAAAILIANDAILLAPTALVCLWLTGGDERRELALRACAVGFLALGINQLIGLAWYHPRPFAIGLGHTFLPHAPDSSFPSDHMTVFAGVGLTLLLDGAAVWAVATLLTGLGVAWARVFLGVHFPLDMAGAVGVAVVAYTAVTPLWRKLGVSVTDLVERLYRHILARPISMGWIRG